MSDYRFAIRAYPSSYRIDHGAELVDVANELTGGGWSGKQSSSLVAGGLRARAREATDCSSRGVWASGVRVGLLIWLVMGAAPGFAYAIGLRSAPTYEVSRFVLLLPLVLIAAMVVSTRWWVAVLITAEGGLGLWVFLQDPISGVAFVVAVMGPWALAIGLAWWLALSTDGSRAARPLVGGALVVGATVLAGTHPSGVGAVAALVLVLGGLVASRTDPRIAAGGTVYAVLIFSWVFPFAVTNDDAGWRYWGPITFSVVVLSIMLAASWSGIKRMVSS